MKVNLGAMVKLSPLSSSHYACVKVACQHHTPLGCVLTQNLYERGMFFFMTRKIRSRYLLIAHRVKTPLLCNSSQTTQERVTSLDVSRFKSNLGQGILHKDQGNSASIKFVNAYQDALPPHRRSMYWYFIFIGRNLVSFFFMTRETHRHYPLGAHKVKPPLLCNNSQTTLE
ncbi:hypothetical protein H5410_053350, partial [Solanum commersonii]